MLIFDEYTFKLYRLGICQKIGNKIESQGIN
jgi:hypothetical protein